MRIRYSKYWWLAVAVVFISLSYSCANMASPNGGPYDEAPPKFVSSTPVPNQLNYKGKKVEILFDELIKVDNPLENVVVTPPQKSQPVVQANGRRVTVELEDSLLENTTYTIDFTNSISDNKRIPEFLVCLLDRPDDRLLGGVGCCVERREPGANAGNHDRYPYESRGFRFLEDSFRAYFAHQR